MKRYFIIVLTAITVLAAACSIAHIFIATSKTGGDATATVKNFSKVNITLEKYSFGDKAEKPGAKYSENRFIGERCKIKNEKHYPYQGLDLFEKPLSAAEKHEFKKIMKPYTEYLFCLKKQISPADIKKAWNDKNIREKKLQGYTFGFIWRHVWLLHEET